MSIQLVENVEVYNKLIVSSQISIALFSAPWAEQCQHILQVMTVLAKQDSMKSLQFLNVAAEELPDIALKHQVEAVPTIIFFQNNKAIDRIDGVDIAALTAKCKKFSGYTDINDRLRALINKAPIMVFMKGDRVTPKCGFSRTLIQILNEQGVAYETFDILTDEVVRQELKTFSDWPTYPQVYSKGELLGGLDIIKEMLAAGELIAALNG